MISFCSLVNTTEVTGMLRSWAVNENFRIWLLDQLLILMTGKCVDQMTNICAWTPVIQFMT